MAIRRLLAASLLTACSSVIADISQPRQQELHDFLVQDCGSCHGLRMKGGLGPALLPQNLAGKPAALLVQTVLEGRDNTAMPPWKSMLSREEATWLIEQLQHGLADTVSLAGEHATRGSVNRGSEK